MIDILDAIRALDPNTTAGVSNNDINKIHWQGNNPKNLTKEQIQIKYDELVEADKKLQYQRDRKYPEIGEQLDKLFHDIDQGKLDKTGGFFKALKAVKDAHPKG